MRIFLLLLAILFSNISKAQDHLEPEDSIFSYGVSIDVQDSILAPFLEIYDEEYIVRAIVSPSFAPEYAIAIKMEGKEYKIVHIQVAGNSLEYTDKDNKTKIIRKEKVLSSVKAEDIISVWEGMLLRTKYVDYREGFKMGLDGTFYHFSMTPQTRFSRNTAGKIWSPDANSPTGLLVGISHDMVAYTNDDSRAMYKLESKLVKLTEILNKKIIVVPSVPVVKIPK